LQVYVVNMNNEHWQFKFMQLLQFIILI
jgi:hypothetical protein